MDFEWPSEDDPRRQEVRAWLADHPHPSGRDLAEAGWVVPHWPPPYGSNADPVRQLIIEEEFARAGVGRPSNPIGIGWAGPTILAAGTEEQRSRYLWPALSGEEFLFSPALTIGGGTWAVQRNIISELVPGLPRDP